MMAFWYHFAILFEALFILTTVDAGTRVARFMIQDLLGTFVAPLKDTRSWTANVAATAIAVGGWGWFLYQGVTDPLGGINTLWPMFGISNQMLAAIALTLCTVVLFRMKRERYAWVTMVPLAWLLTCTLTAGWQKIFHADPRIGFLAHADRYSAALARGEVLAPASGAGQMRQVIVNDYINAGLCALFIAVLLAIAWYGLRSILAARRSAEPTAMETADALA
jgi:carbon starvation protein